MGLSEFIENNDVDYTKKLIDKNFFEIVEKEIGCKFGPELKKYILTYGYLGFEDVEFYGINSNQGINSDMVSQTKYIHKYFEKTKNYVAFENLGEGDYVLVDSEDNIYEYDTEVGEVKNINSKLFEYILKRFNDVV